MAHAPMPWVKLHTSRLDDVRFNRLPDPLKWRWAQLTMLAGRLDAGGAFVLDGEQLSDDELAWQLRIELETWQQDSEHLKEKGYLLRNGHGWQLTDFMDNQGPDGKHADQRAQWRERQERHREKRKSVTGDTGVSHATQSLESESEKSQESEKIKSQSVITRELLTLSAVPEKHHARLTDPSLGLTVDDFLAELARNYARIGSGRGQVKHPPMITALNLEKNERPAANWYTVQNWREFIPPKVLQHARPDLSLKETELQEDTVDITGYTNCWMPENPLLPDGLSEAWEQYLAHVKANSDPGREEDYPIFNTWIRDTRPLHYSDGKLIVAARNSFSVEWLTENNFPAQTLEGMKPVLPDLVEVVLTTEAE